MKVDALLGQVLQHTRPPGLRLASRIHGLCAADLIHGTEIVYSEDSESNRLAYQQRFRCDLWFLSEKS